MKIRSELQKYLYKREILLIFGLLVLTFTTFISIEIGLILVGLFLLYVLILNKKISTQTRPQEISIIENMRLDNDTRLFLISYHDRRFLIFSGKNGAFKISEENNNV
jgi:flagellar biogenesis protein FliO